MIKKSPEYGTSKKKQEKRRGKGILGLTGKPGEIAIQRKKRKATKTKPVGFCSPQEDFGRCVNLPTEGIRRTRRIGNAGLKHRRCYIMMIISTTYSFLFQYGCLGYYLKHIPHDRTQPVPT